MCELLLQALELGPFTSQLLVSADCHRPLSDMPALDDNLQSDYRVQPSSFTTDLGFVGLSAVGQSDATLGVGVEGGGGSDGALAGGEVRSTSQHVGSSSATEFDIGISDAVAAQSVIVLSFSYASHVSLCLHRMVRSTMHFGVCRK